jgi:hypothetical protein
MSPSHARLEITEGNMPSSALLDVLSQIENNDRMCELSNLLVILLAEGFVGGPNNWAAEMVGWRNSRTYYVKVDVLSRRLGIDRDALEESLGIIGYQVIPDSEGYVYKLFCCRNKCNVRLFSYD